MIADLILLSQPKERTRLGGVMILIDHLCLRAVWIKSLKDSSLPAVSQFHSNLTLFQVPAMVVNLEKSGSPFYLTVSDKILFLLHRYQQPML